MPHIWPDSIPRNVRVGATFLQWSDFIPVASLCMRLRNLQRVKFISVKNIILLFIRPFLPSKILPFFAPFCMRVDYTIKCNIRQANFCLFVLFFCTFAQKSEEQSEKIKILAQFFWEPPISLYRGWAKRFKPLSLY